MIDPRYLVRLDTLPFEPAGAPTVGWCPCSVSPLAAWCYTCHVWPDRCLDLSAPPGDPPERLDALGWACAILASRGHRNAARALLGYDADVMHWSDVRKAVDADVRCGRPALDLTPGNGLHRPDAGRAVVAAALRKTHVQTESP